MRALLFCITVSAASAAFAAVIPNGNANNALYYHIGGGSDFALPPVQSTQTINLNANTDLSSGYTCGAFNPALSIANTLNDLQQEVDNVEQGVLNNATGSLVEMPMYFLAQANPTAYNLINNALLGAHNQLDVSTKSCQTVKDQIASGQDPYKDWATLALNNQWKQNLSLTANGSADINTVNSNITANPGSDGVPWVQGSKDSSGNTVAGGYQQPVIHVIADTVIAGYNAMLNRSNLNDTTPAPQGGDLAQDFPTPAAAVSWITNVVGDQTITTCTDISCTNQQGTISGRGLLPWITTCNNTNNPYCASNIQTNLTNLVTNQAPLTKENLAAVSADNLMISPQVINAMRAMDSTQQNIVISKLAQEVATQHVIDQALLARNILQTGSQVPVIANNQPAQTILHQAIQNLDKDIQSLAFEAQVRRQMMSDTISNILAYQSNQQQSAMQVPGVTANTPMIQNSALPKQGGNT